MKRKFFKALLALLVMCTCIPLTADKAEAAETITIYIQPGAEYAIELKMNKGDTLVDGFKKHPEAYKQLCNPSNTTVMFYTSSDFNDFSIVWPNKKFTKDTVVYARYYQPINEVRIGMRWPTAGEYSGNYKVTVMDSSAHYRADVAFGSIYSDPVTFVEGKEYGAIIGIGEDDGYVLAVYNPDFKIYLNGVLLKPSTGYPIYLGDDGPFYEVCIGIDFTADKKVGQFVDRMYNLCLGRKPDTNGYNNWVTNLMTKTKSAAQIVYGFFNSAEFKKKNLNDDAFVTLCYKVMFDRKPDAGGKKGWLEKLGNGVSRNFVLKGFVESAEFSKLCQKYGIKAGTISLTEPRDQNYNLTKFVARMYELVMGRKFDVGGINNWCKKVLDAKDRRQAIIDMAFGFFHSKEFINKNTSHTVYVRILYEVFFDRIPDEIGWESWVNKLVAGTSRDEVLLGFANSAEFTNVLKKYKLL